MAEKATKKTAGRPSKFSPEMSRIALNLMEDGASKTEVCAELGISRETFYQWVNPQSPYYCELFSDAIKTGEVLCQAWWEKQGRLGMWAGKNFNATTFIFNMKNRFPKDWREQQALELTGKDGGPIETKDLSALSDDELMQLIRKKDI